MTTQAELIIKVDSSQAAKSAATLDTLASSGAKAEKAIGTLTTSTEKLGNAASAAARMLAGLGLALGTREIIQMGDAWKSAENQLRMITSSAQNLVETQKRLMGVSNETRTGFEATANLYARLTRATSEMGLSQRELVGITTTINQSFAISGATAAEAAAAITQLSQGLAAGALRGDEFNSVAEQAPGIMRAIADSLGMTNGELRKFAQTGGITAEIVVTALQKASASIENDFAKANMTLGQAIVVAKNNMLELVGANETLQAGMAGAGRAIIGVTTALQDSVPWVTTAKESLRFFFEDTNDAIKIIDTNMSAMFRNIGVGGVSVAEVLTLSFGSWLTNTKSLIQLVTVEVAAFIDKVQAKTENQFDADARAAAEKVVADARLSAIDAIVTGNKKELESLFELINAAEKGKEAFEDLMAARAGATDDGLLNDANFDAWLDWYDRGGEAAHVMSEEVAELTNSLAVQAAALTMTAREQVIFETRLKAGATATEEEMAALVKMNLAIFDHAEALEESNRASKAAEKAAEKLARESEKAADDMAQNARRLRESFGEFFADMVMDGSNAFDSLLKSFKRMLLEMVGQLAASGIMKYFAGGLAGGAASGALGSTLGAVAGGTGLFAAGSQFLGGLTGGAIGTNSMLATGASTAGASISAAIGAIPGWGWALMATAVAAKLLSKESTPSYNAGLLLDPLAGVKGQFGTEAFASGLQVTGFSRRASQADAEEAISLFRDIDATLTALTDKMGITARPGRGAFTGLDERGLGSGLFLGSAGEEGIPGKAIQEQADQFALQWITGIKDAFSAEDFDAIISAGGAEAMAAKYAEIVKANTETLADEAKEQEAILSERAALQAQYNQLALTSAELLDMQRNALDESNRAIFDSIQALKESARAEQDRADMMETAMDLIADAQEDFLAEQTRLITDHYDEQLRSEEDLHNRRMQLFRTLMDYTAGLRLGNLSPLNPAGQLAFAQSQFSSLMGTAQNTSLSMEQRVAAAEKLTGASTDLLNARRGMFASAGYKEFADNIIKQLESITGLGTNTPFDRVPIENQMLEELKKLNDQVVNLTPGISGVLTPLMDSIIESLNAGETINQAMIEEMIRVNVNLQNLKVSDIDSPAAALIAQSLAAGNSVEKTANLVMSLGAEAVTAAGEIFRKLTGSTIAERKTPADEIAKYVAMLNSTLTTERDVVLAATKRATELGLGIDQIAAALGKPVSELEATLAKYGVSLDAQMLTELERLNTKVLGLPEGFGSVMAPLLAALGASIRTAGGTTTQATTTTTVTGGTGGSTGGGLSATQQAARDQMEAELTASGGLEGAAAAAGLSEAAFLDLLASLVPQFATGGVSEGPASGYMAQLHGTEAVVPLPNGRSIPVEMRGSDNKELVTELKALRTDIATTNRLLMTGSQFSGEQMRENNDKLDRLTRVMDATVNAGSARYTNAHAA